MPLHHDHAIGCCIPNHDRLPRQYSKFLCTVVMRSVANPGFLVARSLHLSWINYGFGFHVVVVHQIRVDVEVPVDHLQQEFIVSPTVFWTSIPKQLVRNNGFVHQGLVHGKDVGGFLGFVGTHATWGMKHPWRHIPTRARLQAKGLGVIGNLVVPFVEVFQAIQNRLLARSWSNSKEGVWKISSVVVHLWGEIVGLWLSILPRQFTEFI